MQCIMRLEEVFICYFLLHFSGTGKAEMISKCAVNGTEVEFWCSGARWWEINYNHNHYATDVDHITLDADVDNTETEGGFQITYVSCYSPDTENQRHKAALIVVDDNHQQVPLDIATFPINKTTLFLEWENPPIYNNITFTVVISVDEDFQEPTELRESFLLLNLAGKECQPFQVNISMPGNCNDAIVTGSLLIDPPYPMAEDLITTILQNKTIILSWQQPENIFEEHEFTYNITAESAITGIILEQRIVILGSLERPREEFNFTEVEFCGEIYFVLTQVGDCRERHSTELLAIFPGPFVSEVDVDTLFFGTGELGLVEVTFQPPDLCEFQKATASYVLSFSDGNCSWSTNPETVSDTVTFTDRTHFIRDKQYIITATVRTEHGNVSSTLNFSTISPLAEARLDDNTLVCDVLDGSTVHISWDNPANTLRNSFTYVVEATVVSTGEIVAEKIVPFAIQDTPFIAFHLNQYTCEEVKCKVHIFNSNESVSRVIKLPAYPLSFKQDMTADTFMIDGTIKELEVTFTPPPLCSFQSTSYIMSFTSGSESWSRDPVVITDTSQPVKEDIETGFVLNKNYTVAVTVFMEHANLTSSANFSFIYHTVTTTATGFIHPTVTTTATGLMHQNVTTTATDLSSLEIGGIVGGAVMSLSLVLLGAGVMAIYYCRQRKRRIMKADLSSRNKIHPTVTNPIYETGEDVYEELPDPNLVSGGLYTDVPPPLPSARYDHLPPTGKVSNSKEDSISATNPPLKQTPKQDPKFLTLPIPLSKSAGDLSTLSGEDNYTVMSPAGTVTMMPRNRHSGSHSVASGGSAAPAGTVTMMPRNCHSGSHSVASGGSAAPGEGRFTLNCV